MIIDGKSIANDIRNRLKAKVFETEDPLSLGIIVTKETPQIRQFVKNKEQFGKEIEVKVEILQLDTVDPKNEDLLQFILHSLKRRTGLIVQLPIPPEFHIKTILDLLPMSHDVDVLGNTAYQQFKEGSLPFLPPVVGAFQEILRRYEMGLAGKDVLVIGDGRLVGGPTAVWAERGGAHVTVATKETDNLSELTKSAEIIFSGTGVPGLLQPDMLKEGVALLDAGSGEMAGVIKGDADPACADKATVFTPTPGGIGPITVAKVFENLLALHDLKHRNK